MLRETKVWKIEIVLSRHEWNWPGDIGDDDLSEVKKKKKCELSMRLARVEARHKERLKVKKGERTNEGGNLNASMSCYGK